MNDLFQAISLILGIIISCVAVAGILARLGNTYQTQASIDLLALANPRPQIWRIDRKRMAALFLGVILYSVVLYITGISGFALVAPNWDWVYSLPIVVPLFFGMVFGPWVGLFVGGAGEILSSIVAARINSSFFFFPTSGVIVDALIGFIAGLSFAYTRGKFNNVRAFVIVEIIGAIGILFGDYVYSIFYQNQFYNSGFQESTGQIFMSIIVPDLVCGLVLLPILLTLYDRSIAYES